MSTTLKPTLAGDKRVEYAQAIRDKATRLVESQYFVPKEKSDGESESKSQKRKDNGESTLVPPIATFTKSLPHNDFGIVVQEIYAKYIAALNAGFSETGSTESAAFDVTLYSDTVPDSEKDRPYKLGLPEHDMDNRRSRSLESPLAGETYVLQGPDPDAVAMPPAPTLGSHELIAEMAEVYAMALLRDVPFNEIDGYVRDTENQENIDKIIECLNKLAWFSGKVDGGDIDDLLDERSKARRQGRFTKPNENKVTQENIFRGSSFGCKVGPTISQFLFIGNSSRPERKIQETPTSKESVPSDPTMKSSDPRNNSGMVATRGLAALSRGNSLHFDEDSCNDEDSRNDEDSISDEEKCMIEESDGFIQYGAQLINQRIVPHLPYVDYMTDWNSWLDVQNGADRREIDKYLDSTDDNLPVLGRFIHTPRDLATYVHFDALYQAYLNACLILISRRAETDLGMPEGPGHPTRAGFATFGDPHVLTLVTETATRALKAVRRQKYQIHLRARPEAIGGALTLAHHQEHADELRGVKESLQSMCKALSKGSDEEAESSDDELKGLAGMIVEHNKNNNTNNPPGDVVGKPSKWLVDENKNLLLPMAFPEGSPVHASYGAGHATVAGSCTTILKAFFEMYDVEKDNVVKRGLANLHDETKRDKLLDQLFGKRKELKLGGGKEGGQKSSLHYRTDTLKDRDYPDRTFEGGALKSVDGALTIEGELNKLAANISIGRNFAGVHYYTDYYESLRMGERIAVQILQEHMLTYGEAVSMRFTSFDGDRILITGKGGDDTTTSPTDAGLHIWSQNDKGEWKPVDDINKWWNRAMGPSV